VPATWQTPAAEQLLAGELRRMGRWLRALSCRSDEVVNLDVAAAGVLVAPCKPSDALGDAVRLAITGGPLSNRCSLFGQIHAAGGDVVLDATEGGPSQQPGPRSPGDSTCDRDSDPALALARAYLSIPSVHQRPNHRFFHWLKGALVAHEVEGLIVRRFVWCDLWHAEFRTIAEEVDVPVLDLEIEMDSPAAGARTATRIEGFSEMLRASRRATGVTCGAGS
jgi:hypothetical protein